MDDIQSQISVKNHAKLLKIKPLEDFYDLCIFNSVTSLDLDVVIDGFLNSKYDWQRKFYARSIILILHEHLEKIHSLMNSKFYSFISFSKIFESIEAEVNENKKKYKNLNKIRPQLHKLRNSTIGHRVENGEELYNSINSLELNEILKFAIEAQKILQEFIKLTTKIIITITENFKEFYKEINKSN